jgi:hypothetical protein
MGGGVSTDSLFSSDQLIEAITKVQRLKPGTFLDGSATEVVFRINCEHFILSLI